LRAAAATAVLLALLLTSLAVAQGPAPISVVSPAGTRSLPVTLVNGQEYVALDDVAAFLPLSVREDRQGGLVVTVRGRNIVAPRDRPLVSVDGRVVSLPGPLTRVGSRWLAPVDFVPRALGPIADQRVEYRRPSRLLLLGTVREPRVTPRVEAAGGGARITFEIAPPAGVTTVTETDGVVVRIDADALDLAPVSGGAPAVAQIRADPPATLTVALAPAAGDTKVTTSTTDTIARVVIDVAAPGQPPDTSSAAPSLPAAPVPALLLPAAAGVWTVVIDPGHGGDDSGVKGPGGTLEKQITLDLAKRLKSVLEARMGVHVVLTRDDDRVVTLDERTATANNAKGHVFVSLHMNGSPSPARTGPAVFFMRLDREGEDTRREAGAQAQALPVLGGGTRVIETIRWDLAQVRHLEASQRLATLLAGALTGRGGVALPPVQPAPLRVLAGLDMPAVLFEMGYLSSAAQEKAVAADDLRGTLVQAIYDAVNRFATEPAPLPAAPPPAVPPVAPPAPVPPARGRR